MVEKAGVEREAPGCLRYTWIHRARSSSGNFGEHDNGEGDKGRVSLDDAIGSPSPEMVGGIRSNTWRHLCSSSGASRLPAVGGGQ